MFWTGFISALMPALVKLNCVPESPIKSAQMLTLFAVSQAGVYLATNAIISLAANVFPVPLSLFTAVIPMSIAGRLLFYRHLPKDPQFHAQSNKVNLWVTVEMLPVLVYPAFTVAFMALSPLQQFWVSFLLPLVKLAIRRVLWTITKDDYDLIAGMTSCVGHLYHILFIAMVLQNSKSLKTMGVIAATGLLKMLLNCRYLLQDAQRFRAAKEKLKSDEKVVANTLQLALTIAQEPRVATLLHKKNPSLLLSTYPGFRGLDFVSQHEAVLQEHQKTTSEAGMWMRRVRALSWSGQHKRHPTVAVIQVTPPSSVLRSLRSKSTPTAWANTAPTPNAVLTREAFVSEVASTLHQSEMILLRSYVTIWMASFYVIYLVAVFGLPNREFFATLAEMTTIEAVGSSVTRLILLCGIEIGFMGVYLVLIQRHFGVSGVYQLAFILSTQRVLVQSKTIQLTVVPFDSHWERYHSSAAFCRERGLTC